MKTAGTKIVSALATFALLASVGPIGALAQASSGAAVTDSYAAASGGGSFAIVTLDGAYAGQTTSSSTQTGHTSSDATVVTSGGQATAGNTSNGSSAAVTFTGGDQNTQASSTGGTGSNGSGTGSGSGTSTTTQNFPGFPGFPGFPCFPAFPPFPGFASSTSSSTFTGTPGFTGFCTATSTNNGGGNGGGTSTTTNGTGNGSGTSTPAGPVIIVVTPSNPHGWETYGLTASGTVAFVQDATAPMGTGALQLTTGSDNNSVTHYREVVNHVPLSTVTGISYATKQISAADKTNGNATLRISIDANGDGIEDDQLMYEPYFNGFSGSTGWNNWTITPTQGKLWSNYGVTYNGKGGENVGNATNFTLSDVLVQYPNAKVLGLILSMGSYNPSQVVNVDAVRMATATNDTTYNFEPDAATTTGNGGGSDTTSGTGSNNGGTNTRTVSGGGGGGGSSFSTGSGSSASGSTSTGAGQVLGAAAFNFTRDLHIGMSAADVQELQAELIAAGLLTGTTATGYFGQLTRASVAYWQEQNNISPAAGYFGPISRAKYAADGGFYINGHKVIVTH